MQINVWNKVIKARWWSALSLHSKSVKVVPWGRHGTSNREEVPRASVDTSAPPEGSFLFTSREVKCWVSCDHTGPLFRACPRQAVKPEGKTNRSALYFCQTVEIVLCRKVLRLPLPDVPCLFARLSDTSYWVTRQQPHASWAGLVLGWITLVISKSVCLHHPLLCWASHCAGGSGGILWVTVCENLNNFLDYTECRTKKAEQMRDTRVGVYDFICTGN